MVTGRKEDVGLAKREILSAADHFSQVLKLKERWRMCTSENLRFDRCIVDWTNQCKSHLPLVAKSAFLQTATAAHISGPIYETFLCSGSLKPGSFGYLGQTALALIGPI